MALAVVLVFSGILAAFYLKSLFCWVLAFLLLVSCFERF